MKTLLILITISLFFTGICGANNPNQEITTYYALIEPDLEGHAYFQFNVQNFNYNQSRIFGISVLNPNVENYSSSGVEKSYDYTISVPDTRIDIFYNNGKTETIDYFSPELKFLGVTYENTPVPSQMFYINTTDEMKNNNISNFNIKYYDSNFNSEKHYDKYPFDRYNFTYDIGFLNESLVVLTISPINPNNFYDVDVSLNHIYTNKNGLNFEEKIDSVYDGVYRIDFKTKKNESLDEIKITYTRKMGLSLISFYVLFISVILIFCIFISNFLIKIPKELNAIVFGTFLTVHTFSSSIGYAYRPSWLVTVSLFDIMIIINSICILAYFILLVTKWKDGNLEGKYNIPDVISNPGTMPYDKIEQIKEAIAKKESAVVAFSGGVDSAVLASLAFEVLGQRALAVTADFLALPRHELNDAIRTAGEIGIPHRTVPFDAMAEPGFAENTPQRCYYCKKGLIRTLAEFADREGFNVILEGTNASEVQGYRPGWQAILEAGDRVFAPFVEFGVTKEEVREIARALDLSVADRPSMTCLSTRFPYGQPITEEGIKRVESAEGYLSSLGFNRFRVRDHASIARIEVTPSDFDRILQERDKIAAYLKKLGFSYVTLDMEGFRSGSMDEVL